MKVTFLKSLTRWFFKHEKSIKIWSFKVVCNEKQGGSSLTVAIEACLPFKFAVVFNFNVFPFPSSKLEGNDLTNRKIHQISTCFFISFISQAVTFDAPYHPGLRKIYWAGIPPTHYPSFILLYISLSLYLDSFSFLHLPISTFTSPFPSQSLSPSLSSSLSLSPSIKRKLK